MAHIDQAAGLQGARGNRPQEGIAIRAARDAVVHDDDGPLVFFVSDEAAEALLKKHGRESQLRW